jgi:hypothetical protein
MSGIIGHLTYAILAGKAAARCRLPIAGLLDRHRPSYLAGAYLGCDVQTLPEAVCRDTGQEVGYGTVPLSQSPITGGVVSPWTLKFEGSEFSPRDVHRTFYGRAHLVFGWTEQDRRLAVAWDDLPEYMATVVGDALTLFGSEERHLAYVLGWMTHIVSDSLIKSVRPGIDLHLLDGKYTPRNRPIQDLICFHEIGRKELRLDWSSLLADLVDTPVEPIQLHYMRVCEPRGQLANLAPGGWIPERAPLLRKVLAENRRYQGIRNGRLLKQLALSRTPGGWQCDDQLSKQTGGLTYAEMVDLAETAGYRRALRKMAEAIVDMFVQVHQQEPLLNDLAVDSPSSMPGASTETQTPTT